MKITSIKPLRETLFVVKNQETDHIIAHGTEADMNKRRRELNKLYQTDAHIVQPWGK